MRSACASKAVSKKPSCLRTRMDALRREAFSSKGKPAIGINRSGSFMRRSSERRNR